MESRNNPIVLTLNDDISSQLLEPKSEDKTVTGHSSVALWIKSLKDPNDSTDDSRSDQDNNDSFSSDQDELQLGAEATDLQHRKNENVHISSGSLRDSDSEDNQYFSRRSKRPLLRRQLSEQRSSDSDTSYLSSIASCSVSSLLTARESDPEEVLKGLGFGGPNIFDNIPDRFITAGSRCEGVNVKQFLHTIHQDSEDSSCTICHHVPWVMARVDDIPDQFLRSSNLKCSHIQEFTNLFGVPAVKEPTPSSDGIKEQPGKINHLRPNKPLPFPSKFGTFLEPVSEEVELSSQGSVNLSPVAMKTLSFESNRSSTLKGDSYEESPENIMKIPSLKDLWTSQPDEAETECSSRKYSGNFETVTDDVEEYSIEQTDHAQNQDEDSEVSKKQWDIPGISESIPTVADYLAGEEILVSDESLVSLDVEDVKTGQHLFEEDGSDSLTSGLETLDKEVVSISTSESSDSIQKSPSGRTRSSKNIAPVKISKTAERTRKISTVTLPDRKNFSLDVVQSNGGNSSHTVRNSHGKLGKQVLGRKEITKNTLQLNLYKNWVGIEETGQRQIHMSNKEHLKYSDSAFSQSHKSADAKVIVKHFHFPSQIVLPEVNSQDVKCFSNFKTGCVRTSEVLRIRSAATSRSCSGDSSGFLSLTTPSEQSTPEQVGHNTNVFVSHHNPRQPDRVEKCKELVNDEHKYRENELLFDCYCENDVKADSAHSFVNDWRNNQQLLKNGKSIEEELDRLHCSLKEVKQYKAGIHLMQLATSVESVSNSEQTVGCAARTCQRVLGSIQKELRHLEEYITDLQEQLTNHKKQVKNVQEQGLPQGSDFSKITRQLLQEQLKILHSTSASVSPSPSFTPNTYFSNEEPFPTFTEDSVLRSDPAFTEDSVLRSDINELRKEVQLLRQENTDHRSGVKFQKLLFFSAWWFKR